MIWRVRWVVWALLFIGSFAGLETWALMTGGTTLSRFVWDLSAAFPPFGYFMGFATGFLVCHFWWGGSVSFKGKDHEDLERGSRSSDSVGSDQRRSGLDD